MSRRSCALDNSTPARNRLKLIIRSEAADHVEHDGSVNCVRPGDPPMFTIFRSVSRVCFGLGRISAGKNALRRNVLVSTLNPDSHSPALPKSTRRVVTAAVQMNKLVHQTEADT